ncbi:sodium ion-translocating decarboxylase subunit beta [Proteiniborus sp. MB09-C3]|uniref:sodium ion-translocating decarboxylase subunit beta n=1 Tax=Proteiniborus sp. MB09-C3 TaxID=3050072 RepID=UPI002554CDD4|nr:sodium ion-translocating decarboxylase subunit beta [Proteiniborus sp. MB09-C3]WIV13730.1 sodium ion-translocating decarboxylase subunit beta [Proteiniborus sp. MB09-C3]
MKVYYNSSIWSKGKGPCGLAQKTNWEFEYAGTKRIIPAIYRFSQGIVFDIITILDEKKLRKFFEKYEAIEETLTPLQRRCAEQEHPYQSVPIKEIFINEKQVENGYSSSGAMSIPWEKQNDELISLQRAYSSILKDTSCFACERFCVPYPETDSKIQKLLRFLRLIKVDKIKLCTYPMEEFFPLDIHFKMSVNEEQKELCFNHPITGIKHTLFFQNAETTEFPITINRNRILYNMHLMYEIEPALPQGDTLQFGTSIQYTEPEPIVDGFSPDSASSIGIIGGADGPTAIFISSSDKGKKIPCGHHGLPLHSCLSVLSFQNEDASNFIIEGINIEKYGSYEYNLQ